MGTHLREPIESYSPKFWLLASALYPMNTIQKSLCPCALDESSFGIGRVNPQPYLPIRLEKGVTWIVPCIYVYSSHVKEIIVESVKVLQD